MRVWQLDLEGCAMHVLCMLYSVRRVLYLSGHILAQLG
jgi:hypothetical protein